MGVNSVPSVLGAPKAPFAWRMFLEEEQRPRGTREQLAPEDPLLVLPHEGGGVGPGWCQGGSGQGGLALSFTVRLDELRLRWGYWVSLPVSVYLS